jgi:hypothetical protein
MHTTIELLEIVYSVGSNLRLCNELPSWVICELWDGSQPALMLTRAEESPFLGNVIEQWLLKTIRDLRLGMCSGDLLSV